MKYVVIMERFWGLKETVSMHKNLNDAIMALQVKKQAMLLVNPNQEVVFTISTVRGQ